MTRLVAIVILIAALPAAAAAHSGGLNAEGCHNNRKTGEYHCHRGPKAGQAPAQRLVDPQGAAGAGKQSVADRLRALKGLCDQGLVTPQQYEQKQAEILKDL